MGNPTGKGLKPIKKGEVRNPKGKPKLLKNVIKGIPTDTQEQVYKVLAYALTLPDTESAKQYLEKSAEELGQYGFVFQIAIKQLLKDGWGWNCLMDIMDRLYGKPRISAEVTHSGGISLNITTDEETKKDIEGGLV